MEVARIRQKIRSKRIGSNASSEKYENFFEVEDNFKDLALFVADTNFCNIMVKQPSTDDVFKVCKTLAEVKEGLFDITSVSETCSLFEFSSLDLAWTLMNYGEGDNLFYVVTKQCFVLYIIDNVLTEMQRHIFDDEDLSEVQGCALYSSFQHWTEIISIDSFIAKHIDNFIERRLPKIQAKKQQLKLLRSMRASQGLYLAFKIMIPSQILFQELTRHSIVNRIYKRQELICAKKN
jgi:hypothetical protein